MNTRLAVAPFAMRGSARRLAVLGIVAITVLVACSSSTPSPRPSGASPTSVGGSNVASATVRPLSSLSATLPVPSLPPVDLGAVPSPVHVEAPSATSAWIGPAGGTLRAAAGDGTTYELDIPKGALIDATAITMTPVTAVDASPLSGGLQGAVFLQPVGLAFAVPGLLHIHGGQTGPSGTSLVGFDLADDGVTTDLIPAFGTGGDVTVAVLHFSVPGAGYGTSQDLARFTASGSHNMGSLFTQLLAIPTPWDGPARLTVHALISAAFQDVLEPELRDTITDAQLLSVIKDWDTFVLMLNLTVTDGDTAAALPLGSTYSGGVLDYNAFFVDGQNLLGNLVDAAIQGNTDRCNRLHDLHALANVTFWMGTGSRYDPLGHDWTAPASRCAKVAIAQFNAAANLRAGVSDSLQLAFHLVFTDGSQAPGDFELALTGQGFAFTSGGGTTLAVGEIASEVLAIGVTAQQPAPYALDASACWSLDGLARNLCSDPVRQTFGAAATPAAPAGTGGSADWAAPCRFLSYAGTITDSTDPANPKQIAGHAQLLTACNSRAALLAGIGRDDHAPLLAESVQTWQISGDPSAFTATMAGCNNGNAGQPCSANETIQGAASPGGLTFTITAVNLGQVEFSFSGQLVGSGSAN